MVRTRLHIDGGNARKWSIGTGPSATLAEAIIQIVAPAGHFAGVLQCARKIVAESNVDTVLAFARRTGATCETGDVTAAAVLLITGSIHAHGGTELVLGGRNAVAATAALATLAAVSARSAIVAIFAQVHALLATDAFVTRTVANTFDAGC